MLEVVGGVYWKYWYWGAKRVASEWLAVAWIMNEGGDEKAEEWTCVVSKDGHVEETSDALERVVVALPVGEDEMAGITKCDNIDR